jgi:hypothetical protein
VSVAALRVYYLENNATPWIRESPCSVGSLQERCAEREHHIHIAIQSIIFTQFCENYVSKDRYGVKALKELWLSRGLDKKCRLSPFIQISCLIRNAKLL